MATPTKEELQQATNMLLAADKNIIEAAELAIENFNVAIDAILDSIADAPAPKTKAVEFAQRLRNALSGYSSYELFTLKNEYGMGSTNPTTTP